MLRIRKQYKWRSIFHTMLLFFGVILTFTVVNRVGFCVERLSDDELEEAARSIKVGIDYYKESDFNEAIQNLNKGLAILEKSINKLKATKELINAHLHLGLAYIGVNKIDDAKNQFKAIIELDPKYTLDATAYSRKVISLFNEVKAEYLSQIMMEQKEAEVKTTLVMSSLVAEDELSARKKPIYKKWWFWTLTGAGALGIVAAASQKDESEDVATGTEVNVLLADDFEDGDYAGWYPYYGTEFWTVEQGMLTHLTGSTDTSEMDGIQTGSLDWRIGSFEVTIGGIKAASQDPTDYEFTLYFGVHDSANLTYVNFYYGYIYIIRVINDEQVFIDNIWFPLEQNKAYRIKITINDENIRLYVDDNFLLEHSISVSIIGQIALSALRTVRVQFDDVRIEEFSDESAQKTTQPRSRSQMKSPKIKRFSPQPQKVH